MSLTDLSYYLRKYFPYALIFSLLILIIYYSLRLYLIYFLPRKPQTPYIAPIFDKITKPIIKDLATPGNYSYALDTIEGRPIYATSSAKVYLLPPASTRFGYREKIYLIAKTLGFNIEKTKHELNSESQEAVFQDETQQLSINITNFNFSYTLNFANNPQIFENTIMPSEKEIENKAINILTSVDRYPQELAQGKINLYYFFYDPSVKKMTQLDELREANMVEVDFYRPDIDGYPIVLPQYPKSQNQVTLVFYNDGYKIVKAQVKFFEKSEGQIGIYPLKTGEQAWSELASGSAMLINYPKNQDKISINKMFLGYLDPDIYQAYLQPVYVFLGDSFVAYVSAIASEYVEE